MSLVIHSVVRNGIVVSADTRMTSRRDTDVRYSDTSVKIVPFPNNIVVTSTGDDLLRDDLSSSKFLYDLRRKCSKNIDLSDLPIMILNEYLSKYDGRTSEACFMVSGYTTNGAGVLVGRTYGVDAKRKTITQMVEDAEYTASVDGVTELATTMLKIADFDTLTLEEAISLSEATVTANIEAYKYATAQIIGGEVQTYVIDIVNDISGWFIDGKIVPDENAPDYTGCSGKQKNNEAKEKAKKKKKKKKKV